MNFSRRLRLATDMIGRTAPGHYTLLGAGATDRALVLGQGEWWRLFTAPFLHGSASHLIGNLTVLLLAGPLLESAVGSGWFAMIYLAGGLGGSLLSLFADPADMLSTGASGAIIAILGAMFAASFHDDIRWPIFRRVLAGFLLFPALVPAVTADGAVVGVNAHLGGALTGTALIFIMMMSWREAGRNPVAWRHRGDRGRAAVRRHLFLFSHRQREFRARRRAGPRVGSLQPHAPDTADDRGQFL